MSYFLLFLENLAVYFYLIIILRILGKKEMSRLTLFDFILYLLISELMTLSLSNKEISFFYGAFSALVLVFIDKLISYIELRFKSLRRLLDGKPSYIIFNGDIDFSGRVKNDFSDANMYLTFSNITDGKINVNQINLYAGYSSDVLELRTVQSVIPINFNLLLNLLDKSLKVSLQTENLRPLEVFSTNYKKSQLEKYKNISFTSFSNFSYNLSDNKMVYDSEGRINVPKESLYDGFDISYSLVGNEKNISLNSFEGTSKKGTLFASGISANLSLAILFNWNLILLAIGLIVTFISCCSNSISPEGEEDKIPINLSQ